MKKLLLAILGGCAVVLTGCFVLSVHPYYDKNDLVFDADLLGRWSGEDQLWRFEPDDHQARAYKVTYSADGKSSVMAGHLFKLEGGLFLNLQGRADSEVMPPAIPSHYLVRVHKVEDRLEFRGLNYEWLGDLLEKEPQTLRHVWRVNPGESPDHKYFVLTADTADLRAFILKHLKNDGAWNKAITLKRPDER